MARVSPAPDRHETRIATTHPDLLFRVGPAEFSTLGAMVVVRCPHDLDPLMRAAGGGLWEPGGRRWLITRVGPLMRNLRRATDPLFRQAGIDLDGEGDAHG